MNQRIITAAVTLVLAVVILPQRNETAPPPQPADNLRGHVVDRQGKGLLNATLELYPNCDEPKDACEKALKSTTSNNEGAYSIDEKGLTPGVYRLMAQLLPYTPKMKVPVNIPADNLRPLNFILQQYRRDEIGKLAGLTPDDAKEIFAAAKAKKDAQLSYLTAEMLSESLSSVVERLQYRTEAIEAFSSLRKTAVISGTFERVDTDSNVRAVNRLTGEVFNVFISAHKTFEIKVTGVGSYDLFLFNPKTDSGTLIKRDVVVEPTAERVLRFPDTTSS